MDNPTFVDEENIPMVHDEEDYDERYDTPNVSRVDETSFLEPGTTEVTSTVRLKQKLKRAKINALYKHLNVAGNPDLIDLDRYKLTKDPKKGVTILEFYNGDRWIPLTEQAGCFFAPKTLKEKFGGLNIMRNVLGLKHPLRLKGLSRLQVNLRVNCRQTCRWKVYH